MKLFIYLLFFSLLASCTVTKRQHRGGYHIEWKKHYALSSDEHQEKQEVILDKEANEAILITAEPNNQTPISSEIAIIDEVTIENTLINHHSTFQQTLPPVEMKNKENTSQNSNVKKVRPIYFNDASIENMRKAGWIIMAVGLFLFLCVLLASAPGITAAGSIGQLILYIIFALLGLLLILLFGPVGAFIFTLCLALAGVVIALIAMGIQKRRKRFYEPD